MTDSTHDDPQPWTVLESTYLSRKPWMTLRKEKVQLPSGATIDDYFVLEYPDWVNVIAITTDGQMVLIRQYRHALGKVHFELPAGVSDPADVDPETSARRELLEETGFGGGHWKHFMTLSPNPSTHANLNHTFLAIGVSQTQEPAREHTEDIRVHLLPMEDVEQIVLEGRMIQSLHAAPLLKYLLLRSQGRE